LNVFSFNLLSSYNNSNFDYELVFYLFKLLPFFFSIFGVVIGYYTYYYYFMFNIYNNISVKFIFDFFVNKWFFDLVYNKFFLQNGLMMSYEITYKLIDKNFLELLGVNIFSFFFYKISFLYKSIYSVYFYNYLILLLCAFLLIIMIVIFKINIVVLFILSFFYFFFYLNSS